MGTRTAESLLVDLEPHLAPWQVPALQVAAVQDGEVVVADCLGTDRGEPANPRTVFHHGSCGKAYTSLLATTLTEEGVVDLDAPVREHVPELRLPDPVVEQRVTLRDLLSHRSGLGRHDLLWILDDGLTAEQLVARLAHVPLGGDFRTTMGYSNLGYALAGLTLERAAGATFPALLRDRVLAPLDMTSTTAEAGRELAQPYVLRNGELVATEPRTLVGVAPAGQLLTTAEDAARWLQHQLSGAATVAATHEVAVGLPAAASPLPELQLVGYGLGWVVVTYRGRLGVWHSGGVDGFLTMTLVLPGAGIGVTASANRHMSDLPLKAVLHLADRLLGESGEWLDPPTSDPAEPATEPGPPPARPLTDYAGTYSHPGYGELRVDFVDDALVASLGSSRLSLQHKGSERWDLGYEPLDAAFPVTFVCDAAGRGDRVLAELDATGPVTFVRT